MIENGPKISAAESADRFGKNVEIHAIFVRHGDKDKLGELTDKGKNQASEFGENLENKDAIKGYSSPIKRVVETIEKIIEKSPHNKKLETRIKTEIGIPPISREIGQKLAELERQDPEMATEWFLNFGDKKPDAKTTSPHEIAESLAYILTRYLRMADKLYSGSNIDLINGTHQGVPESLLKEVLKRKVGDKEVIGFDKLEEIGGGLKFAEAMDFDIKTDDRGGKEMRLIFRDQEYGVDMGKLEELSENYQESQKKAEDSLK